MANKKDKTGCYEPMPETMFFELKEKRFLKDSLEKTNFGIQRTNMRVSIVIAADEAMVWAVNAQTPIPLKAHAIPIEPENIEDMTEMIVLRLKSTLIESSVDCTEAKDPIRSEMDRVRSRGLRSG